MAGDLPEGASHEIFMFPQCPFGGRSPSSWEPWACRAGGFSVIAIIWDMFPAIASLPAAHISMADPSGTALED